MLPYLPTAPFLVQESAVGGFSCKVKNAMHADSHPLHSVFLPVAFIICNYLCTRAPAPPMMASTSFLLAMVVSPGVVIASAP